MEDTSDKDYLGFKNDSAIKSIVGDEKLLFSDKIIKVNRYGLSQERNILITDKAIYNLKRKSNIIFYNKGLIIILYYSF